MGDVFGILSLVVTALIGLGAYVNSKRGVKQKDRELTADEEHEKAVREDMIARERREELERLYPQLREMRERLAQMDSIIRKQYESDRREKILYLHVKDLRDHILDRRPPPPPEMPQELVEWFEGFDPTGPR